MSVKLEQYIAEQKELIASAKQRQQEEATNEAQRQREALLDKLGIYEEELEYTDDVFTNLSLAAQMGYTAENRDGKVVFFKKKKIYPTLTDGEYEALLEIQREKDALGLGETQPAEAAPVKPAPVAAAPVAAPVNIEPVEYTIKGQGGYMDSFGGSLMKILAILMWVGGFIAAIVLGRLPTGYYGEMVFNFWLFLAYLVAFFIAGGTYWAIGELFNNVASINGGVHALLNGRIVPEKRK